MLILPARRYLWLRFGFFFPHDFLIAFFFFMIFKSDIIHRPENLAFGRVTKLRRHHCYLISLAQAANHNAAHASITGGPRTQVRPLSSPALPNRN